MLEAKTNSETCSRACLRILQAHEDCNHAADLSALAWLYRFDPTGRLFFVPGRRTDGATAPNWQKENRILVDGRIAWLRLPTSRVDGPETLLKNVRLRDRDWASRHLDLIHRGYGDKLGYARHAPALGSILKAQHETLADLNIAVVTWLRDAFQLSTPLKRASHIPRPESNKAQNLLNLCNALGATHYLSPRGADGYCREEDFATSGVSLTFQDYTPRPYDQGTDSFVSHLSALDLLLRDPDGLADLF